MTEGVYIAGVFASPTGTVRRYPVGGGSADWTQDTTYTGGPYTLGVVCCTDADGNLYVSAASDNKSVKKFDPDGNQLWYRTYASGPITGLAVDADGNVFVASYAASSNARKYSPAGSLLWSKSHSGYLFCVCVDADGNSYWGGGVASSISIRAYNAAGGVLWTANHGDQVRGIAVDADGNVYIAGYRSAGSSNKTHRQYNSSGTLQWSADHGYALTCAFVDAAGDLYVGGYVSAGVTVRKLSAAGSAIWSRTYHGTTVWALTTDASGNLYLGGAKTGGYSARKYNSAGTLQWSLDAGNNSLGAVYFQAPQISQPPGLALEWALGLPASGFVLYAPALALALALGVPTVSALALLPDTPGAPQPIYRGWVSGGDLLEIPLISLQCRRRRGDSTWLSVRTSYSVARWADLTARLAAGAELLIDAGYRAPTGEETTGLFLRAAVTAVDQERTGGDAIITLTARVIPTAYSSTSRPLYGVTRRGLENGRQTARCAVIDPLLRPGDTVDDGLAAWEVGAILYFIGADSAFMDVTEDA